MKITNSFIIFLVATCWILMAVFPPWQITHFATAGSAGYDKFYCFAPIFQPPFEDVANGYIDLNLLMLAAQFISVAVVIPVLAKAAKFDFASVVAGAPDKGAALHALFKGLSIVFVLSSFALIAPGIKRINDRATPGYQVERTSIVFIAKPVSQGDKIMPDMLELRMVRKELAPADALENSSKAIGFSANKALKPGHALIQSDLSQ
jgi:hypothetical protein